MTCQRCSDNIFKRKLGRCTSCMRQLTLLSVLGWPIWLLLYRDHPTQVNAIALGLFCCAFTGLLMLHWIIRCQRLWRARALRQRRQQHRVLHSET
ncbi:DUF3624 domain-containing protein [Shewanella sp. GXUN23E]|uniref:DUF3624 domain-containing protein n=1 Tax=Shewanella sp. GXUN23E TaxID=3422498 RepID=UPI003D7DE910